MSNVKIVNFAFFVPFRFFLGGGRGWGRESG